MTAGQIGYPQIKALALMDPAAALRDDALRGSTMGAVYDPLNVPAEGIKLPWGGQILGRDYITTALSLPIYETAALYTGPTFIIHGTADRVVPYTYGERFNQVIKGSEINLVDKDDHVFSHTNDETASKVADFFSHSLSKNKTAYPTINQITEYIPSKIARKFIQKNLQGIKKVRNFAPL